jgi:hypothetical protein
MNIKLSKVELPILKEVKPYRGSYYMAGEDNKFFNELIKLYEKSSIHNSFLNNLIQKVFGSGMVGTDETSENVINDLNLNDLFKKITMDYCLYGGYAIEIIWNTLHTKVLELNYIDFSRIRSGFIDEETDEVELYYYSYDWTAYHKKTEVYQRFNFDTNTDRRQIYYHKGHHPGTDIYPRPFYYGGISTIYTDIMLTTYYTNLVKNNFVGNTIIHVPDNMDSDKQIAFEKGIKENFTSSENAGSIVVLYGDGENSVELLEFGKGSDDAKYQWLTQSVIDRLIVVHNIPNPIIAGVRVSGSLGGTQEMQDAERIYNVNKVYPTRGNVLDGINELNDYLITPISYEVNDIELFKTEGEENGNN